MGARDDWKNKVLKNVNKAAEKLEALKKKKLEDILKEYDGKIKARKNELDSLEKSSPRREYREEWKKAQIKELDKDLVRETTLITMRLVGMNTMLDAILENLFNGL
jgi:hypothetical protein